MPQPPSSPASPDKPVSQNPSARQGGKQQSRSSPKHHPPARRSSNKAADNKAAASTTQRRQPTPTRETTSQRPAHARSYARQRARRAAQRRLWLTLGGVVVAVGVVVGVFFLLAHQSSPATTGNKYPSTPADPKIVQAVTTANPSVLATVGTGSGHVQNKPTKLNGAPPLTSPNGKPQVFYQGADYCPFCAAQRWSLIVALSRFGTFNNLSQIRSSASDVYPNTATFSFYGSTYTSQYIDFAALEEQSYPGVTLQTPTARQQQLISKYNPQGSFPFIDFANQYSVIGASYDPQVLSNLDWQAIANALANPQSPIAQSILGTANYMTAAICQATNQQPANVCQAAPIPQVQQSLNGSTGNTGTLEGFSLQPMLAAELRAATSNRPTAHRSL